MHFRHSSQMWSDFPDLAPGIVLASGITADAQVDAPITRFQAIAASRLADISESELPEIQAWRRAFSKMGLKPTQYRCASEALLRRFRKEGDLPRIHPLIDLCNAASLAFAIPVAVFDIAHIAGTLEVRRAAGDETYLAFSGETENPEKGEAIFADAQGRAHARRWTNRQSALSAIRVETRDVLIVAEALHDSARADVSGFIAALASEIAMVWQTTPTTAMLSRETPQFALLKQGNTAMPSTG
jgi:DNA/RNA-binding domain of Phe-tRNA-synthetase-like protein